MEVQIGDKVRFLNDIGGGTVTKVVDRLSVMVMNEFGFEVPSQIKELVVIESADDYNEPASSKSENSGLANKKEETEVIIDTKDLFYPDVFTDDTTGDNINIHLAFVPQGRPGNSDLNVFLINDSNYNVLYSIINIDDEEKSFSNSVGILEANTKEQFETLGFSSVNQIPEYLFHLVFYKKGEFAIKQPVTKSVKMNPVKFYKERAYNGNDFFNEDSILIPVFTESILANELDSMSRKELNQIIKEKESVEPVKEYSSRKEKEQEILEVDLHIHELLDDFRGLTNGEILEVQMDHFNARLEDAAKNKVKKLVFIHGVGNGTLKLEIRKELDKKKKILTYQDASFKEYGYGATMVHLK